jgi:predicted alpha/beta superfamily hydrolase
MIKKLSLILTIMLFFTSTLVLSTEFNTGERITINSTYLNEEREIQILLPESYRSNMQATYPVIYLLDGDYVFQGVAGMLDFMANKGQLIPDVILVGIADKGTDKYRQYMTPEGLTAPFEKDDSGKAKLFLNFLEEELKPYISLNYRTANNSILVGHSIGGLFVLNALFESPDAFENFVSISPSVWLNDHAIMEKAKKFIGVSKHKQASLYLSLGDEIKQGLYGILHLLDKTQPKNIQWTFSHYPNENHNSVVLVALRSDLKSLFKGWFISDKKLSSISPEILLQHYKELLIALTINQPIPTPSIQAAIRYFYRHKKSAEIPEFMINVKNELPASEQGFIMMWASYVGHFESPEAALALLLKSETDFKYSVEYIKSIASTYEQLGNKKLASNYYEQALKLGKSYKANQWQLNIIKAKLLENHS